MQTTESAPATTYHPLEPLTAAEIAAATAILRREYDLSSMRVHSLGLHEPAKESVLAWPEAGAIEREAFYVLRDHARRTTVEAVVSLTRDAVVTWREIEGVQPNIHWEEGLAAEAAANRIRSGRRRCGGVASSASTWRWSTAGRRATLASRRKIRRSIASCGR